MFKRVIHIDEKSVHPSEKFAASSNVEVTESGIVFKRKPIVGLPKVYDLKGNLLADEENLVVLDGREFFAQKLINQPNADKDLRKYEIRYFGVGKGGASGTTASDPQDNDTDLANPVKISTTGISTSSNNYKYIADGYLKRITADGGSINIVLEEHEVNTSNGETTVQKYTTVKFILKLMENEPADKPFTFNEAALYAVKYDDDGNPTNDHLMVSRFTTIDKNLGPNDGLLIEWSLLV